MKADALPQGFQPPIVKFATTRPLCGGFADLVRRYVESERAMRIADLGGGANPLLEPKTGQEYTVVDISPVELAKTPVGYRKIQADLAARDYAWDGPLCDIVLSRMVAEHMPDGRLFHQNVLSMLKPGGLAIHCFPTLYSPPFLVNRLLSDKLSDLLLALVQPRDRHRWGKFPAYYSWCRGPSASHIHRFTEIGYRVVEYHGLFGHSYFEAVGPVNRIHRKLASLLVRHPLSILTSYAFVVLRKAAAVHAAGTDVPPPGPVPPTVSGIAASG